jgi:hypothetical protein
MGNKPGVENKYYIYMTDIQETDKATEKYWFPENQKFVLSSDAERLEYENLNELAKAIINLDGKIHLNYNLPPDVPHIELCASEDGKPAIRFNDDLSEKEKDALKMKLIDLLQKKK